MLRVYQKLENNQYIPFDNYTMLYAYELEEIAWRKFGTHMDRGIFYEYYLKDGLHPFSGLHRLDGPAYEHYYKNQLKNTSWYVKGIWLKEFESYFDKNNPGGSLLLYLKDNPRYINEIAILAKHNHWLTEEKRLLLEFAML